MFSNNSPLNWHNTLKRLKKDDNFGRSPHSLNHVIVKRKPATLYMAQATRDIVKDVDKVHKEVPGVKKLIKEAGAKGGSDVIADGTATSSANGTHIGSREGSASFISSERSASTTRTGDLRVEDLSHSSTDPVRALARTIRATPRRSAHQPPPSAMDGSFHTAHSGSSSSASSATKDATRKLFSESVHLPASQVSAVNNRSKISRAKGASTDSAIKPLSKRATPARGAGGKFLKRAEGGAAGRTAVVKEALKTPGEKPKRRRAPKSAQTAEDNHSVHSNEGFKPKTRKISAQVGPKPRRRAAKPEPPAPAPPTPAPATPAAPASPGAPTHYDQIKNLRLPGIQKLVKKHSIPIPDEHMQSPQKMKAHIKKHFGL